MDQRRLINLNHDKCARVASEHRKEMLETAPGANRLNVADKNPHAKMLTDKGRNILPLHWLHRPLSGYWATLQQKKNFGDFPSELRQVTGKENMKTRG